MFDSDLLRFNTTNKYCIWDLETCHLNLAFDNYPWQLGLVIAEGKEIKEVQNHYIRWPDLPSKISPEAARITRFNRDIYEKEAQDPIEVLAKLDYYLYHPEYKIIFQNGLHFDYYVHRNSWAKPLGMQVDSSYLDRCFDTKALSMAYRKGITTIPKDNFLAYQYKLSNYLEKGLKTSLESMIKEFNIPCDFTSLHDGVNDCIFTFKVFQQLLYKLDI